MKRTFILQSCIAKDAYCQFDEVSVKSIEITGNKINDKLAFIDMLSEFIEDAISEVSSYNGWTFEYSIQEDFEEYSGEIIDPIFEFYGFILNHKNAVVSLFKNEKEYCQEIINKISTAYNQDFKDERDVIDYFESQNEEHDCYWCAENIFDPAYENMEKEEITKIILQAYKEFENSGVKENGNK